ncbi:hypothetical protein LCGC14_0987240 [marine sediment metagenome]|uniref:Peptidase M15A C-terminal domain-containing protein n=2 Tax=root TaxID=1 RepID=A0A9C9NI40_9HYPH|nr:hypothetical protein [Aurantimonas coralicida]
MSKPSPHFSWAEFACNDGTAYPQEWRATRAVKLAAVLEDLRAFLGDGPLSVGSVFRTPDWNKLNGGAKASQHLRGRAADCYPPRPTGQRKRLIRSKFHRLAREFARIDPRVGAIGLYRWGVHLDTRARKNGRLVVWNQVSAGTAMHDGKRETSA